MTDHPSYHEVPATQHGQGRPVEYQGDVAAAWNCIVRVSGGLDALRSSDRERVTAMALSGYEEAFLHCLLSGEKRTRIRACA
jgi:hypothetical protein